MRKRLVRFRLSAVPWKKILLGVCALFFILVGSVLIWASTIKLPDVSTFQARKIANSSKITDRTGEIILYDIHQSVRRTEVPLSEMGDYVKNSIIAIEDSSFYQHKGIRVTSIVRALIMDLYHRRFAQGGSTITQQIVKNTLLTTDKTVVRKLKEWVLALKLERHFSKDEILQIYLNDAPYGGTIYGVEEASQAFFNKHANEVTLAEAAYLAAIPEAPTYYSPFGKNRDKLENKKNLVLRRMFELNFISEEQYTEARNAQVAFNSAANNSIKAPHFVFYILDYLQQKYGPEVMESGGYTIRTTLDFTMQKQAEELVKENALKNDKQYNASNSALVAMDPTTGQILAMVGSRDYFDKSVDGAYNVALAKRQPGSSFKPFVYATAFAKGYTPDTVLFDVPTEFSTSCSTSPDTCYHPGNFDDKYKGPMQLRSALAESRNVPSVKLLYLVGLDDTIATAQSLGITTLGDKKNYGLSLVLGGGEVTLLDMVSAYGVFANSGFKNPTTGILEVRDHNGSVIEQFGPNTVQVMDKNAVLQLNDVLSDPVARTPTFGSRITIPGVAVKTGTTNDDRDAWIVGYTPNFVVGVWSGNNNNRSMRSGGAAVSGPTWKAFMDATLPSLPPMAFEKPIPDPDYETLKPILRGKWMGNDTVTIDSITGLRATDATPPEARIEQVITNVHSILYWVDKDDPRGPPPSNPNKDPQFRLWEPSVQAWWGRSGGGYNTTTPGDIPSGFDTVHTDQNSGSIGIQGVPSQLRAEDTINLSISSSGQYPLSSVDLYISGNYLTTISSPFRFSFSPKNYGYQNGRYNLRAVGTDSVYNHPTSETSFTITE